jgi:single-stranded-DNA-specific exonuclease
MSSAPVKLVQRKVNPIAASRMRLGGPAGDLLARLFVARGVKDRAEVMGTYDDLLPVHTMKNVLEMANYLADAAILQKKGVIVADYDCDGATACSAMSMGFIGCGMNFGYMVPDRIKHGYGLTPTIVDEVVATMGKPDFLITVDNGISSAAGVERAREFGIDVLITDHHLAPADPAQFPKAKIIVNPNQPGCTFESKSIAGCGVAWYVIRALIEELKARDMDPGFTPKELLGYIAIGTVADIVKLDRNNRILVNEGLKLIRQGICAKGITALARVAGKVPEALTCEDIGFAVGPRLNAAGRLAHMGVGIECLTTFDEREAHELAMHLDETNVERREIQKEVENQSFVQASLLVHNELIAPDADAFGRRSLVVFHESFHEGVVGVVAGRLKEMRHRPTIVMTEVEDGIKGSGRSIPGFHLKHALDEINAKYPGVLLKFGGHAMAAGMTIAAGSFDVFRNAFEEVCRAGLTPEMLDKTMLHDGELSARHFDMETIFALSQEVWGQGFEAPIFLNKLTIEDAQAIGKQEKIHLKMKGRLTGSDEPVDVMAFYQADLMTGITDEMTVAFKPGINTFREVSKLQLLVELMPEQLNPTLSAPLRAREALEQETIRAAGLAAKMAAEMEAAKPEAVDAATDGDIPSVEQPVPGVSDAPVLDALSLEPAELTTHAAVGGVPESQVVAEPALAPRRAMRR